MLQIYILNTFKESIQEVKINIKIDIQKYLFKLTNKFQFL